MVEIETARLRLRPPRPDDAEAFHAILSDSEAMRYWSTVPHETIEQTRQWLQSMIEIPPGEGEDFIIEHRGQVIGKAGMFRFPEVGFILHPSAWGQGFATEALRPILDRAFGTHGLARVVADVDPRNAACLRLLAGLGFREVGRRQRSWHIGGHWYDSVDLTLTPDDWRRDTGSITAARAD